MIYNPLFFLVLEAFGLLNDHLKKRLQICSEISFLRKVNNPSPLKTSISKNVYSLKNLFSMGFIKRLTCVNVLYAVYNSLDGRNTAKNVFIVKDFLKL